MPPFYTHTKKMKSMEKIICNHCWTLKMEKSMKLNKLWDIGEEDRVTNTLPNGWYPITEALWEPKSSFTGVVEILQEYQEHHQL